MNQNSHQKKPNIGSNHFCSFLKKIKLDFFIFQFISSMVSISSWGQENQRTNDFLIPFDITSSYVIQLMPTLPDRTASTREQNYINISALQIDRSLSHSFLNSFFRDYQDYMRLPACLSELNAHRRSYTEYLNEEIGVSPYIAAINGALSFMDWLRKQPNIERILNRFKNLNHSQRINQSEIQNEKNLLLTEANNILNQSESISINCDTESDPIYEPRDFISSMRNLGYQGFLSRQQINVIHNPNMSSSTTREIPASLIKSFCRDRNESDSSTPREYNFLYIWHLLQPTYFTRIQESSRLGLTVEIIYSRNRSPFYFLFDLISGNQIELTNSNNRLQELLESYRHPEIETLRRFTNEPSKTIINEDDFQMQENQRINSLLQNSTQLASCSGLQEHLIRIIDTNDEQAQNWTTREQRNAVYNIIKPRQPSLLIETSLSDKIRKAAQELLNQDLLILNFSYGHEEQTENEEAIHSCTSVAQRIESDPITNHRLDQLSHEIATWYKNKITPILTNKLRTILHDSRPWLRRIQEVCSQNRTNAEDILTCQINLIDSMFSRTFANESECEMDTQLIGSLNMNSNEDSPPSPYLSLSCTDHRPLLISTEAFVELNGNDTDFVSCQKIQDRNNPDDSSLTIEWCMNSKNLLRTNQISPLSEDSLHQFERLKHKIKSNILYGQRGLCH